MSHELDDSRELGAVDNRFLDTRRSPRSRVLSLWDPPELSFSEQAVSARPDLAERILVAAGDEWVVAVSPSRRRSRLLASVAAAAAVAALAVTLVVVQHHTGNTRASTAPHTRTGGHRVQGAKVPSAPEGFTANEYRVGAPALEASTGGGIALPRPTCRADQLTASAATRRTSGGVLGVARLVGDVVERRGAVHLRCALPVKRGPTALRGAHGRALHVSLSTGNTTGGATDGGFAATYSGRAIWGFAWLGSYCGGDARSIDVPLTATNGHGSPSTLHVPLRGPQPHCGGSSSSSLVDGIVGFPDQPVQPPRPDYAKLRLTGRIRAGTDRFQLAPTDLTLTNTGAEPVTLDPCPAYQAYDSATAQSGGFSDPIGPQYLPCTRRSPTIRPGEALHLIIPATVFDETATRGSAVDLLVDIAGVGELHLHTTAG